MIHFHYCQFCLFVLLLFLLFCCCCCPISSVPTSEPLLLHRSTPRPYQQPHTRLVPHRGSASRGAPKETSDRSWAAIRSRQYCTAAKSLWWCLVVPVLIQHTQDITPLCPILTTMLAAARSQTEWAFTLESRPSLRPSTNPSVWTLWH